MAQDGIIAEPFNGGIVHALKKVPGLVMGAGFILPKLHLGEFTLILITLGLGIIFEALAMIVWGTDPQMLPSLLDTDALRIGGASLTTDSIIISPPL